MVVSLEIVIGIPAFGRAATRQDKAAQDLLASSWQAVYTGTKALEE
jgi:hypothetical protein